MPRDLIFVLGAVALLGALALLFFTRARPGAALVLVFQIETEPALTNLVHTYGNAWYQRWLDALEARLRDTNGEPPEAVIDTSVEPNRRWLLVENVMVTYVREDRLPQPRGRWDVTRRVHRWWTGYTCEVIVTAVADLIVHPVA